MILREIKNMYFPVYQQIEYLEVNSDHQQYIDTEIKCSSNMTFDLNIYIPQYAAKSFWCFGGRDSINVNSIHIAYQNNTDAQKKIWRYGNAECLQDGILGKGWHRFQNNSSGTLMIDNSINLVTGTSTFSIDVNFYLLTLNLHNTPALANTVPGARIKQSKIYISNVLVRDFIPVRVGSVGYLYDRVSKRLFGNKGTGNFILGQDVDSRLQQIYQNKLIEGEDYETYDWLKGSVPIGTQMMSLPINSSNCNFTYIWGSEFGNMGVFLTNGYSYYNGNNNQTDLLTVYDSVSKRNIYYKDNIAQPTTVNASDNVLMINNSIYPKYGFPITFIRFNNAANSTSEGVKILSSISVDGVTRYVPCQLLHSIPRNLDAQCKERVAGECGMIDLISGKFYGNVASSGTFTVENDNE